MVYHSNRNDNWRTTCDRTKYQQPPASKSTSRMPSIMEEPEVDYWKIIREHYVSKGYSQSTVDIITSSWRQSSQSSYKTYFKKWFLYSKLNKVSFLNPCDSEALSFLTKLFEDGCSYSQINSARSALSLLFALEKSNQWGSLHLVKRFMKGVFELRPVMPKYSTIWDVKIVFNYFRQLPSPSELTLNVLSKKLALLIGLVSGGQRCQTIHCINLKDLIFTKNKLLIPIMDKIKQTKHGKHMAPLQFKRYYNEPKLCVIKNLEAYIQKTKSLRSSTSLFISYIKPHKPIGKERLSNWCKDILRASGINTALYTTHSSRSAASSKAKSSGMSLPTILEHAGWSNENTFAHHYEKVIQDEQDIDIRD